MNNPKITLVFITVVFQSPALAQVKIEEAKRELVILFINLVLF